jgi:predicted enzyme related to lactoylglutathione lyase
VIQWDSEKPFPNQHKKEDEMSNKITWLELASTDIPASAKFYADLFGWPIVKDEQMDYTMTAFEGDQAGVGFSPVGDERSSVGAAGSVLVYVDVADIDATIARAKQLGAPIYQDKMEIPTVGWMAIFGDPGGNRIAVMQSMPRA